MANTAVGYTVIVLGLWLGAGDYLANVAGYSAGFMLSYQLNRRWTFAVAHAPSTQERVRFGIAVLVAYSVNLSVLYLARSLGYVDSMIGQAASQVAYSLTFFLLARFFVFVAGKAAVVSA